MIQKIKRVLEKIKRNLWKIKWTIVVILVTIFVLFFSIKGKYMLLDSFGCLLLKIGADKESICCFMIENAQFLGNAAWTLTSLVGAFSIFYLGSLGMKNCGIENRVIIAYAFGGTFVPWLLGIVFLSTLWMSAAYYLQEYTYFFFISFYLILLQMWLILVCIVSTSHTVSRVVISREEKRRYHKIYIGPVALSEGMALHTSMIMANELSDESVKLLKNFLIVPYEPLIKTRRKIKKNNDKTREMGSVYYFWYQNFRAITEAVNERGRITERNRMYTILYEILGELWEKKKGRNTELNRMESLGAVFQSLILYCDSISKWDAIAYIINQKIVTKKEKLLAIGVLLASVSYLIHSGQIRIDEEWKKEVTQTEEKKEADRAGRLKEIVDGIGQLRLEVKWPLKEYSDKTERPVDKMIRKKFGKQLNEIIRVWGNSSTEERLKNPLLYEKILAGLSGQKIDTPLECLMTGLIQKMSAGG